MANRKNPNPEQMQKRCFEDLIDDLQTKYTYSIRDLCRLLKCSRSFVSRYIMPFADSLYLSKGFSSTKIIGADETRDVGILYHPRIQAVIAERNRTEQVFIHEEKIKKYLLDHIKLDRQTRRIPVMLLADKENENAIREIYHRHIQFLEKSKKVRSQILSLSMPGWQEDLKQLEANVKTEKSQFEDEFSQYLSEIGAEVYNNRPKATARSKTPRIPVKEKVNLDTMISVADIMDYGDTDELYYRQFFKEGTTRIVLELPDENGKIGKKVYYKTNKDDFLASDEELILVKEELYQKNIDYFENRLEELTED